ncbi:MAG: zinc ribbon domain-containing protein [Methanoregula sp.]
MGFPELNSDEPVILQAHNIKVKSVAFEAVLTNKRLILVDSKKGLIPPQEILIATISTVEGGENAIRDPILTLAIFSPGGTARQMILTFPREVSGERRRERDDWLKALKAQVAASVSSPVVPDATSFGQQSSQHPGTVPLSPPGNYGAPAQKKKIEITRPTRNIIEPIPAIPRPVETTTLPVGSFCSRCGNRVPPESIFCNLCGTKVNASPDQPVDFPAVISPVSVPIPQPVVPQVQVPTPPAFGLNGDRKERMLEDVIHSIEPLIEDSVPRRTEAAPLVPRHYPAPLPVAETPAVESPAAAQQAEVPAQTPSEEPVPAGAAPTIPPPPVPPAVPTAPPQKKRNFVAIGVLAIVILAVIGGVFIFANPFGTTPHDTTITPAVTPVVTTATPTPVPTPTPTVTIATLTTPTPTPEVVIPKNGVWLRVIYDGKFGGTYGTPNSQYPVGEKNTGDQLYMVSTVNGPVEASIQKLDGSSDELVLEVYKNGEMMKRASTQAPRGIVEFQVDLKPAPTPTPTPSPTGDVSPAQTVALNSTANATGTA